MLEKDSHKTGNNLPVERESFENKSIPLLLYLFLLDATMPDLKRHSAKHVPAFERLTFTQ